MIIITTPIQAVKLPTTKVVWYCGIMECGNLAIKKTSVKVLHIELYSVFLNMPIKQVQEKEKWKKNWLSKKKNIFFISASLQLQYWITKIMIFYVKFVSWAYIYFG